MKMYMEMNASPIYVWKYLFVADTLRLEPYTHAGLRIIGTGTSTIEICPVFF
jgi:hypothetical protein